MHIKVVLIFVSILFLELVLCKKQVNHEHTAEIQNTDCYRFSKNARFNPYSVVETTWFVFYYWGSVLESRIYSFYHPTKAIDEILHKVLDDFVKKPIDWSARRLVVMDSNNLTNLLVERNHSGYYYMYEISPDLQKGVDIVKPRDVRLKQNKNYIGMMHCKEKQVYVMSRLSEIPRKARLQEAAASLGYHARRGRSYLYQGHHWMPIGEAEEEPFHEYLKYHGLM